MEKLNTKQPGKIQISIFVLNYLNMKYFLVILSLALSNFVYSKNIELDKTAESCKKVTGYGSKDKIEIAKKFKVPVSSVRYLNAEWKYGNYTQECVVTFDTQYGPKECSPYWLLSSDNGKTAFAVVRKPFGGVTCWED